MESARSGSFTRGAAALVVLAAAAWFAATDRDAPPVRVSATRPISAALRRRYHLDIPRGRDAYVIAAGRAEGKRWFVVGYLGGDEIVGSSRDGDAFCYAVVGFYSDGGTGCFARRVAGDPSVDGLVSYGVGRHNLEVGTAPIEARRVVFITDTARTWSTAAVHLRGSHATMFASEYPMTYLNSLDHAPGLASRDAHGQLRRVEASDGAAHVCPQADPPLTGSADGLPHVGTTSYAHTYEAWRVNQTRIAATYDAVGVRIARRDGQVWMRRKGAVRVRDAADYLLRVYLRSPSACPAVPASFDGVPLDFVVDDEVPPEPGVS